MKLLIITSLKEYLSAANDVLRQTGITVYSLTKLTGIRSDDGENIIEEWFGSQEGEYDSVMLFSFTDDTLAANALTLVEAYNRDNESDFPLHAFVLPVELSSASPQKSIK